MYINITYTCYVLYSAATSAGFPRLRPRPVVYYVLKWRNLFLGKPRNRLRPFLGSVFKVVVICSWVFPGTCCAILVQYSPAPRSRPALALPSPP